MSVNSVSLGGLQSYGPLSGNLSQTSGTGRFATEPTPPVTPVGLDDAAPETALAAVSTQNRLEDALRKDAATGKTEADIAGSGDRPMSAAIALYQRVNQIGHEESAPSQLLQRWNSIVQQERDGESAPQAYAQPGGTRFDSGILDLTA
jgi:hypothetical protein